MLSCLKCRKNTESKNSKIVKTKNRREWFLQSVLFFKNSRLTKEQEASGILSSRGLKPPLNKIALVCSILF